MINLKSALLATLIVASPIVASPAFAGWEVWNGTAWVNSGSATFTGPTTATVAFTPVNCAVANFVLTVTGGVATVSGASFGTTTACTGIVSQNLPWSVSSATPVGATTTSTLSITGVQVKFPAPSATCSNGTAAVTLTNATQTTGHVVNTLTFTATFPSPSACTNVKSNPSLTSNVPVRFV